MLKATAAQHSLKPGADRLRIANATDVPHGDETRLLNGVLRVWVVAEEADRRGEEARLVTLEQKTERGGVAVPSGGNQFAVGEPSLGMFEERPHATMMHERREKFD